MEFRARAEAGKTVFIVTILIITQHARDTLFAHRNLIGVRLASNEHPRVRGPIFKHACHGRECPSGSVPHSEAAARALRHAGFKLERKKNR